MSKATVGLVGSRVVDNGLQSADKKTVTEFAFPQDSRTPEQISIPKEGSTKYKGPKTGDSYAVGVEDTHLLQFFFLLTALLVGTYCIKFVQ